MRDGNAEPLLKGGIDSVIGVTDLQGTNLLKSGWIAAFDCKQKDETANKGGC
jgi:hypothetical protein